MRVVERQRDLTAEPDDFLWWKSVVAQESFTERLAGDEGRHRVEKRGFVELLGRHLAGIVQRQDVRMREPRRDLDLARETLAANHARELRMHHLHGDLT